MDWYGSGNFGGSAGSRAAMRKRGANLVEDPHRQDCLCNNLVAQAFLPVWVCDCLTRRLVQKLTMDANEPGSRLAPPTSAPSISGCAIKPRTLSGFTLPPYRMRHDEAASAPNCLRT